MKIKKKKNIDYIMSRCSL